MDFNTTSRKGKAMTKPSVDTSSGQGVAPHPKDDGHYILQTFALSIAAGGHADPHIQRAKLALTELLISELEGKKLKYPANWNVLRPELADQYDAQNSMLDLAITTIKEILS